jgi:DNA-binding transcriptional LysR family regulator
MKPTNEQLRQYAREIVATVARALGLSAAEAARPDWYRPQTFSVAQKDAIWTATLPVITAFVRRFPQ